MANGGNHSMKLGMMMIFVPDLVEAKHFYSEILGFPIKAERVDRLEFVHDRLDFVAFKCEHKTTAADYSRSARSVFVFEVESLDESLAELKTKGVRFLHQEPAENDFSRYAAFFDPFGNVHELCERKQMRPASRPADEKLQP